MLLKDWQKIFYQELQERNLQRRKDFVSVDLKNNMLETTAFNKEKRMQVYSYAFWARQVDSLMEDFPVLLAILGKKVFQDILKDYIYHYPSTNYTLAELGRNLPKFMRDEKMSEDLCDLAKFEWHLFELEYYSEQPKVTANDIEAGRIFLKTSVRLIQSKYPIASIYEDEKLYPPKQQDVVIVVNEDIEYYEVEPAAAAIITSLQTGESIEVAINAAGNLSPEKVQSYFQGFMENGFFTSEPLATS